MTITHAMQWIMHGNDQLSCMIILETMVIGPSRLRSQTMSGVKPFDGTSANYLTSRAHSVSYTRYMITLPPSISIPIPNITLSNQSNNHCQLAHALDAHAREHCCHA